MVICDHIVAFADGEMDAADADAMRAHLPDCQQCQEDLLAHMQLAVRLADPPLEKLVALYFEALDAWRNCDATADELNRAEGRLRAATWKPTPTRPEGAIARQGEEYEPSPGWQQRVLDRVLRPKWYERVWRWLLRGWS